MKGLVNPLGWVLALLAGSQVVAAAALRRTTLPSRFRWWVRLSTVTIAALWILAMPVSTRWIGAGLAVADRDVPDIKYIAVLGGGYIAGPTPAEDVLVVETSSRVAASTVWWQTHHDARLIMTGAAPARGRAADRMVQLMAEMAVALGVPASDIILEPSAANTLRHPVEILRLPGINRDTPIGVVTSAWHMRRAARAFSREFRTVATRSAHLGHSAAWTDMIPAADDLEHNTTLLREWVALGRDAVARAPQ